MLIPVIPAEEEDLYLLWAAKHQATILQKKRKNILQWDQVILYGGGEWRRGSITVITDLKSELSRCC